MSDELTDKVRESGWGTMLLHDEVIRKVIALVEQDVTRRLLSEDAVEAFNDAATFDYYGTREAHMEELRGGLAAALSAIGISTEEAGQ